MPPCNCWVHTDFRVLMAAMPASDSQFKLTEHGQSEGAAPDSRRTEEPGACLRAGIGSPASWVSLRPLIDCSRSLACKQSCGVGAMAAPSAWRNGVAAGHVYANGDDWPSLQAARCITSEQGRSRLVPPYRQPSRRVAPAGTASRRPAWQRLLRAAGRQ